MKNGDKPITAFSGLEFYEAGGHELSQRVNYLGLTKREYFAGLAMQGLVNNVNSSEFIAKAAVKLADDLLTELAKNKK